MVRLYSAFLFDENRGKIIDILMKQDNISMADLERAFEKKYNKIDHRAIWQHLDLLEKLGLISFNILENKKGRPKQITFHKDNFETLCYKLIYSHLEIYANYLNPDILMKVCNEFCFNNKINKIIDILFCGETNKNKLSKQLNIPRGTLTYYLNKLEAQGIISQTRLEEVTGRPTIIKLIKLIK